MFIIAGIQPKRTRLDKRPATCPRCGQATASRQRVDQYFSFFFIPLFRVSKGEEVLWCDHCQMGFAPQRPGPTVEDLRPAPTCRRCGRPLAPDFNYCPYCGAPR
jgi:predicted amidophosphoribosyltransferase